MTSRLSSGTGHRCLRLGWFTRGWGYCVPVEVHYSALRDVAGQLREIVAVACDIPVRKVAEELRESANRQTLAVLCQSVYARLPC